MLTQPLKAVQKRDKLDQKCRNHKRGTTKYDPQESSPGFLFRLMQLPFFLNIHRFIVSCLFLAVPR